MEERRNERLRARIPASDIRDRSPGSRSPSPLSQAFEAGLADIYRTENRRMRASSESGDSGASDSDYSPGRSDIVSPWPVFALEELTVTPGDSEEWTSIEGSDTSSLGLAAALEGLNIPSGSSPRTRRRPGSSAGEISSVEDSQSEQYNFSPERREALMRQMHRDIAAYDAARERAFGREHGYEVYPSIPEPPAGRPKRRRDGSENSDASLNERLGRNTAWRATSPAETEIIISRSVSRGRDRSSSSARAGIVVSVREIRREGSPSSAASDVGSETLTDEIRGRRSSGASVASLLSGDRGRSSSRGAVSRGGSPPLTPRRMPSPLRVDVGPLTRRSRNPVDDFLIELCTNATRAGTEMFASNRYHPGFALSPRFLGSEHEDFLYSTLRDVSDYESSTVDRLRFEEAVGRLQDSLHKRMILAAVADGMDVREAWEFLDAWRRFARNKEWNDVPGMLSMRHMQFWSAIRKGWGTDRWGIWRCGDWFLTEVRNMLLEGLHFTHTPWEGSYDGPSDDNPIANLTIRIGESGLPSQEIERLNELFGGDLEWKRIARIFHEWLEASAFVQEGRTTEEESWPIERLRLDRLERLIREEWLLNGIRTIPADRPSPPTPTRSRRGS